MIKVNDFCNLTFCEEARVKVMAVKDGQASIKIKGDNVAKVWLSELLPSLPGGLTLPEWWQVNATCIDNRTGLWYVIKDVGRSYITFAPEDNQGSEERMKLIDFMRHFVARLDEPKEQPKEQREEVEEEAPKVETQTEPVATPEDQMAQAASLLFGGLAKNIEKSLLTKIMAKVQPILDRAPIEHVHTIDIDGVRQRFDKNEIFHPQFDKVLTWLANGFNVYIYGPAGTGKTHLAKQLAKAMNKDFYFCNKIDDALELTGFVDANGQYNDTPFYKSFISDSLFLFDEMDGSRQEAILKYNSALDNRMFDVPKLGNIKAHDGFVCLAAGNTNGMGPDEVYTGRQKLDAACMQRFGAVIKFDYDPRIEELQCGGNFELLEFTRAARVASKELGLNDVIISYRNIKALTFAVNSKLYGTPQGLKEAINETLWRGLDRDSINTIKARVKDTIGNNKYYKYA